MTTELVYSIKNIFDDVSNNGCLKHYNAQEFYIAAYQRGYKWGSEDGQPISVLINDLKENFEVFKTYVSLIFF